MQRLVYSPKAFVYTKNAKGQVLDLTRFVVAGNVNRRINQVSSAEVTLRNPNMMFTTKKGGPNDVQAFTPMDPITIWLMRVKGHPVRVFTGFLDETPYFELYPGVITLTASCTLKKLLYTFFDPALPYTRSFLAEYGWWPDPKGGVSNPSALADQIKQAHEKDPEKGKLNDGSIGELLYATLFHIGGWKRKNIFIEQLPKGIVQRVAELYKTFEEANEQSLQEWEDLMGHIIGEAAFGDGGEGDGTVGGVGGVPAKFIPIYIEAAKKYKLGKMGPAVLAAVHDVETNFGRLNQVTSSAGAQGHMQFMPATWAQYGVDADHDGKASPYSAKDAIHSAANYLHASGAPGDWRKAIFAYNHAGWYVDKVWKKAQGYYRKFNEEQKREENDDAVGSEGNETDTQSNKTTGPTYKRSAEDESGKTNPGNPAHPESRPENQTKIYKPINGQISIGRGWHESSKGVKGMTNTSGSTHWHSGVDVGCTTGTPCIAPCDGEISFSTDSWSDGGMIHFKFTEDVGEIAKGTIIGWGHIQSKDRKGTGPVKGGDLIARSGNPGGGPHVHFVQRTAGSGVGGGDGNTDPKPLFNALMKGKTSPTTASSGGDDAGGGGGSSTEEMYSIAKATAFATQLEWPSLQETIEAVGLQGQKSLMNDKPLMPFIQQLTDASFRQFQSMPNGNFFAFFPDYFGEFNHRKPYWLIEDIEILDGRITLSDEALATHMYVVGDTLPYSDSYINKLQSGGVVNVFNVFGAKGVLHRNSERPEDQIRRAQGTRKEVPSEVEPTDEASNPALSNRDDAIAFLKRYGARPVLQEEPMIRSPYFEAFLAYQRFMLAWSRQFLTTFTFTFMPELYPGGQVGFPDHGLQMYIDEVVHEWNYESGFTTRANLSAPAVMTDARGQPMGDTPLPENMMMGLWLPTNAEIMAAADKAGAAAGSLVREGDGDVPLSGIGVEFK